MQLKNMKPLFILVLLCVSVWGCGDERFSQPMEQVFFAPGEENVEVPEGTLGPVPPEVQELLWGNWETELNQLLDMVEFAETHDLGADYLGIKVKLDDLCLLSEQRDHYTKYISAGGIAIVGDRYVPDNVFYAVEDMVLALTAKHPEIREPLFPQNGRGFYIILFNANVGMASLPEIKTRHSNAAGRGHCRGDSLHGHFYCIANVVVYSDTIFRLNTVVHEFGHALHGSINQLDPNFQGRLEAAYDAAKAAGKWRQKDIHVIDGEVIEIDAGIGYILNNPSEYWAEGILYWCYGGKAGIRFASREEFAEYDPGLYALLSEWLPDDTFGIYAPL